jgi:D-gamma-glutamyl-meso-diaminopimelic acid endopeptidase CwlS
MKKLLGFGLFLFLFQLLWAQETQTNVDTLEAAGAEAPPVSAEAAPAEIPPVEAAIISAVVSPTDEEAPELNIETLLRGRIAGEAQKYLGVPYKTAGITPSGFDCSGFVYFVFLEAAGMAVSRSTVGLWNSGRAVRLADVQPGDLLIFTTVRPGASHVGIVLENTPGTGIRFVHAASQGSQVGVIISNMNENYYKARIMGARSFF